MATAFGVGMRGPCPVCGVPEQACAPANAPAEVRGAIGAGMFTTAGAPAMAVSRWRSREAVDEFDPVSGRTVLKYGVGTPIPLIEALRQGVATWGELTPADVAALAAHGVHQPRSEPAPPPAPDQPAPSGQAGAEEAAPAGAKGKGRKRPEKDRMVREGQVVQK